MSSVHVGFNDQDMEVLKTKNIHLYLKQLKISDKLAIRIGDTTNEENKLIVAVIYFYPRKDSNFSEELIIVNITDVIEKDANLNDADLIELVTETITTQLDFDIINDLILLCFNLGIIYGKDSIRNELKKVLKI